MKLKRILAAFLTAATLCTLLVAVPAGAASVNAGFTDISDPAQARAAETLRLLGVISGNGSGAFYPADTLTRAQFCTMAVNALGRGAEAEAQMNRTIFFDVLGGHWARGFINLASITPIGANAEGKGGEALMGGVGDGNFKPDAVITYAEAVTVMMRLLGYSSTELAAGANWYDGPLATAKAIGLSAGVSLAPSSPVTRGETALLFENLLYTAPHGGEEPYLSATLGGKIVKEAVILSLDATTDDGTAGAILTTGDSAPYKTEHTPFAADLAGCRAELVLDKAGKVVALRPSAVGSQKTVSVVSTEATYLTAAGGARLDVAPATPVYKDGEALTYKDVYLNLKPAARAVFHYTAGGKLEYLFLPVTDVTETAAVAMATGGNPFSALVGKDTDYRVVKNGLPASIADVRQYDVGTYDRAAKTLYVSDLRLTGVYENAAPSPVTPTEVTVLGAAFPVLPSAYDDLAKFEIGGVLTLLLTADGQVAGAVKPDVAKSTTVGVVTTIAAEENSAEVTVSPLADLRDAKGERITLSGRLSMPKNSAEKLQGQLVTVSSSKIGWITVSRLGASGASGVLDLNARTLGSAALADNIYLYERVGTGAPVHITFAQITRPTVPASKISYVGKDYAGRVNIIVFDDVTGDQYTYGMAAPSTVISGSFTTTETVTEKDEEGNDVAVEKLVTTNVTNGAISVENGGKKSEALVTGADIKAGSFIGVSASLEKLASNYRLAGWVNLKSVTEVPRAAFDITSESIVDKDGNALPVPVGTVTADNMILPVAGNVACYNKTTKKWFASLNDARAYSDSLTVYYDRAPQEGGKVRLVVVE